MATADRITVDTIAFCRTHPVALSTASVELVIRIAVAGVSLGMVTAGAEHDRPTKETGIGRRWSNWNK